jgi:uncharacterized protein (TIGR03067 family)
MRIARLTLMMILSAAGFVIAAQETKKAEPKGIVGSWTAVSMKFGGQAATDEELKSFLLRFEDKTYSNLINGEVREEGRYTLDDTKDPKTIDFDITKGMDEGKKQLAIYQLEGGKLTIVAAVAGFKDRPKSFKLEAASPVLELVLEPKKP